MSDTTPESDPAHIPSIDEVGTAEPAPARPPRRPRTKPARGIEVGFGLVADRDEGLAVFDDLIEDATEPELDLAPSAPVATHAAGPALLAPLSALFYLLATRERTGPTAIAAKKRENPRLYLACVWGDFAYRVLIIAVVALVVVLLALRVFVH